MGRRFVDAIWIRQRMQAKDDRCARELRARQRAVVAVAIVPVTPALTPIVDVALVPVCAWCPDFVPTPGVSHGICAACAARLDGRR